MVNSLRVNAGHGRDFHPLNDGKLSEVADKDLVCLERIVRIWADLRRYPQVN